MEERLQKILSRAGHGSRRGCEELISKGRVTVNGRMATLGMKADPSQDKIAVNGKLIELQEELKYIALNKPRNVISAASPQDDRKTVRDLVDEPGQIYPVGRLDFPAGMVVHPSPGHERGTLVHALLAHCRNLSGIGGVQRPGIVHRLDAGTSGLLIVAKSDEAHIALSRMLMERRIERIYYAVVWGEVEGDGGTIDLPVGRSPRDRKKMAVLPEGGKEAFTTYYLLDTYGPFQYIKLKLGTGRTHQIRVHLSHTGNPVLGDPVYGGRRIRKGSLSKSEIDLVNRALSLIDRQALHAGELSFEHPITGMPMRFEAPPPLDMQSVLGVIRGTPA